MKSKGLDVIPSIADHEVMSMTITNERTILTFDRDYGELIFKHGYKPQKGVILLRLDQYESIEPGAIVEKLINEGEINFVNSLTVVDKHGIRQRKY